MSRSQDRFAWRLSLLAGVAFAAFGAASATALDSLTAVVLRGRAVPGAGPGAQGASALTPGLRVESPAGSWTEIAFSDGSSVVLEAGGDFTLQGIERDPVTGRVVVRAAAGRGRLRVSASEGVDFLIETAGATVRVSGSSAVLDAGRRGSVTLTSGRSVTVTRLDGREDIIRRPGFVVTFENGGPRRQGREQLAEAVGAFAPVRGTPAAGSPRTGSPNEAGATEPRRATADFPGEQGTGLSAVAPTPISTQPPTGNPPGAQPPGPTPPAPPTPRSPGNFALLAGTVGSGQVGGSGFAGPGFNSATSSLDAGSDIQTDPNSQDPGLRVVGMLDRQSMGTARVRRFAPQSVGAVGGTRSDQGVVVPPSNVLRAGDPASGVSGAYWRNLTNDRVVTAGATAGAGTFYDGVVNAFTVTLQILDPAILGTYDPANPATVENRPLISLSDLSNPSVTIQSGFRLRSKADGSILTDGTGTPVVITENDYLSTPQLVANYDLLGSSGGDPRVILHRGGSVLEVGQRPAGATGPAPAGQPFALAGGNGLAVQSQPPLAPNPPTTEVPPNFGGGYIDFLDVVSREGHPSRPTRVTTAAPGVFIIDKVTEGAAANPAFANRGIAAGERYFVIGGQPVTPATGRLPGAAGDVAPGTPIRFAVSDGLNPLGPNGQPNVNQPGGFRADCVSSAACSIAAQYLNPDPAFGRPIAFGRYNGFRPEETYIQGTPRGDTHLVVVAGENNRHVALRSDLQVAADGQTSASVATGALRLLPAGGGLAFQGALVGAARSGTSASRAITGSVGSLATAADGYGGHLFENTDPTDRGGGTVGHFALGESSAFGGGPNQPPPVTPGRVQAVGGTGAVEYGFTRLATNVGTPNLGVPAGPLPQSQGGQPGLSGFAAGLVEAEAPGGGVTLHAAVGGNLGDVAISGSANGREFQATIRVAPRAVGEISSAVPAAPAPAGRVERNLAFGADSNGMPTTAVASPGTFAGVIPGQAGMASVDGDLLAGIQHPDGRPATPQAAAGGLPARGGLSPSNEHLAWGYFLGDLVASPASGTREYVGLGFWVAGRPVGFDTLQGLTGSASYRGGMIGNVADATGLRTRAGDFVHNFNFGTRQGTLDANFDGANFRGIGTGLQGNMFNGSGAGGTQRTLSVQGSFFHPGTPSAADLPRSTGGVFGITGQGYGANGIFVGAR